MSGNKDDSPVSSNASSSRSDFLSSFEISISVMIWLSVGIKGRPMMNTPRCLSILDIASPLHIGSQ